MTADHKASRMLGAMMDFCEGMMTHTKTFADFILNDSLPERLRVSDTAPEHSKTRTYSVVADYDWAEMVLCSGSYLDHANSIARIIGEFLDIPVALAKQA